MQAGLWLSSVFLVCGSTILHSCVLLQGRGRYPKSVASSERVASLTTSHYGAHWLA